MKCQDIMTQEVAYCKENCSIKETTAIMKDLNCGVVPIVNQNEEIVGVVTDRDIAIRTVLNDLNPEISTIGEIMSRNVITCDFDDDINKAINKMSTFKVRRIPVTDKTNKLIGIISLGDVAILSNEEHETFEALEKISESVTIW